MIIDFHAHLAYHKLYPEKFFERMFSSNADDNIHLKKRVSVLKMFLTDRNGSWLLKQMDEAQVDKTVLLIVDSNDYIGKAALDINENYELHTQIIKNHPDRFVVFAGYHPFRGKYGMDLLKKGIEDYGFRGVKLYPPFGFSINDDRLNECYDYCNKMRLPVLIHTGYSIDMLDNEKANPTYVEYIADQFQNVNFILAHTGYKLGDPAIQRLLMKKNIYADISGFQTILGDENSIKNMEKIFDEPLNNKVLFGSDWPITNLMMSLAEQIEKLKSILRITHNKENKEIKNIFFENANRILNRLVN